MGVDFAKVWIVWVLGLLDQSWQTLDTLSIFVILVPDKGATYIDLVINLLIAPR